jgi:hypothetical protein
MKKQFQGWTSWSLWSKCTTRCGGGKQSRARSCKTDTKDGFRRYLAGEFSFKRYLELTPMCTGEAFEHRVCNRHICGASWSPWMSWSECSKSCGFGGQQARHRDCSVESPTSKQAFLTSNVPLDQYLKSYAKCVGIRNENRKCSSRVCAITDSGISYSPIDGKTLETVKEKPEGSNWVDWVSGLLMFQKVTENVDYTISVKATANFVAFSWSNHLKNPTSPMFQMASNELEKAIDEAMVRLGC